MTKIVIIGAGSYAFGAATFRDLMAWREKLRGSTISLVDVNQEYLTLMTNFLHKLNEMTGQSTSSDPPPTAPRPCPARTSSLSPSPSTATNAGNWTGTSPSSTASSTFSAKTAGSGGLFHAMRNIPIVLDIVHDVEKLAPNAFVINFTNPEGRICQAINRYSRVKFVGLCHGIDSLRRVAGYALDLPPEKIDVKAGGLNHFSWVRDLRHMDTGEDLYPAFRKAVHERQAYIEEQMHHTMKLSVYLMDTFGLYPLPIRQPRGRIHLLRLGTGGHGRASLRPGRPQIGRVRADIRRWTSGEKPMLRVDVRDLRASAPLPSWTASCQHVPVRNLGQHPQQRLHPQPAG